METKKNYEEIKIIDDTVKAIASMLKCKPSEIDKVVKRMIKEGKEMEAEIKRLKTLYK